MNQKSEENAGFSDLLQHYMQVTVVNSALLAKNKNL
jgi:hypothetical protein